MEKPSQTNSLVKREDNESKKDSKPWEIGGEINKIYSQGFDQLKQMMQMAHN